MTGEKIYEYDLDVTGVTDYGVTLQGILSGQSKVPPQGARIDVVFAGHATGRLAGRVVWIAFGYAARVGSISIFAQPLKRRTVTGSHCLPTAWARRSQLNRSPTFERKPHHRRGNLRLGEHSTNLGSWNREFRHRQNSH